MKRLGAAAVTYVYDAFGNLAAEYGGNAPGCPVDLVGRGRVATCYVTVDPLGSTRALTDASGGLRERHDYLPFGEELYAGMGPRTAAQGYLSRPAAGAPNPGIARMLFTGKERDLLPDDMPASLDYFGARYFSCAQGRFTSPDPLYIEMGRLSDPQRLSLYAYARNNPLKFNDPTGLDIKLNCRDNKQDCVTAAEDLNKRKDAQFKVAVGKGGKLTVVGKVDASRLSKSEQALFNAISDTNKHATINVVGNTGQSEFGAHDRPGVNTVDLGNLSQLDAPSNAGGLNSGDALAHESMDAYFSLSMSAGAADSAAATLFPGLFGPTGNRNILDASRTRVVGSTFDQAITNGGGAERITIRYITPIPAIELFGKSPQARSDLAHDAGSRVTGVIFVPPKQP